MATTTGVTTKYTIDISENESFDIWNEELYPAPNNAAVIVRSVEARTTNTTKNKRVWIQYGQ